MEKRVTREPLAVYIHTPFCPSKCGYCDFNSYAMSGEIVDRTVEAIRTEISRSPWRGRPAKTIFFGGGTPTYLSERHLTGLLEAVMETHPPVPNCEITSEANPGTVDIPKFAAMRAAGFNRISLGAQSFAGGDLLRLGRVHAAGDVGLAVTSARQAGFDNINLDLMFALPGQSTAAWESNIATAISMRPEHLSLYCLTIEPNTRFYKLHLRGMLDLPDDEAQVRMYDLAIARAAEAGYEQYEISNFSRPGRACAHNLCYWRGEEYAAYGPGAVGAVRGDDGVKLRFTNTKHPVGYCERVEAHEPVAFEQERLTPDVERIERIMMGLRLNSGISRSKCRLENEQVNHLVNRDWLRTDGDRVTLTAKGQHFCSAATAELI